MGGRASRELSESQQTVKRLTSELQKLMKEVEGTKADAAKAPALQTQVSTLSASLQSAKKDLEVNVGKLRLAEAERTKARSLKMQLDSTTAELQKKQEAAEKAEQERRELEEANLKLLQEAGKVLEKDQHPTLGTLVADLGHKLIYRADPITLLAQAQVWRKQRAFRKARAEKIGAAKLKSPVEGWPGTITAANIVDGVDHKEGSMVIIDGQHRLGACAYLEGKGQLEGHLKEVTVEVYPGMQESMIKDLFTEINKCEPVLDVDLPVKGASDNDQEILEGAALALKDKYSNMFKESQNAMRPHVNIDRLRNQLYQANVLSKMKLSSTEQLVEWLEKENEKIGNMSDEELEKSTKATEKMVAKARKEDFFLGLSWDWLPSESSDSP